MGICHAQPTIKVPPGSGPGPWGCLAGHGPYIVHLGWVRAQFVGGPGPTNCSPSSSVVPSQGKIVGFVSATLPTSSWLKKTKFYGKTNVFAETRRLYYKQPRLIYVKQPIAFNFELRNTYL